MDQEKKLVEDYYFGPVRDKKEKYIGVEVELLLINKQKKPVAENFILSLTEYLEHGMGFRVKSRTLEGYPYEMVSPEGNIFSFETSWNTVEFSMQRQTSLVEMAGEFYGYIRQMQEFCKKYDYLLCGRGLNPYMGYINPEPVHTAPMLAKSWYLREFTSHHDGKLFHSICAATQTHLDACMEEYLELFNFLRRVYFVEGMLFANSLPLPEWQTGTKGFLLKAELNTLCFRDELWRLCEAPNTEAENRDYKSAEELVEHLSGLKIFLVRDKRENYYPILPEEVLGYLKQSQQKKQDIQMLRCLEPISPTSKGTIEIRSTCTQILEHTFAPAAFYIGLSETCREADSLVKSFWSRHGGGQTAAQFRKNIMEQREGMPYRELNELCRELVSLSVIGLKARKKGEERFLAHLTGEKKFQAPALREKLLLESGADIEQLLEQCSAVPK